MTVGEIALLIGLLLNAAATVAGIWLMRKVELATNSMKDDLVAATKSAALLQGAKDEREEYKADNEPLSAKSGPVPVADDRTAVAAERVANATERVAVAAEVKKSKSAD